MSTHYIYLSFLFPLAVLLIDGCVQLIPAIFQLESNYLNLREQLFAYGDKISELELAGQINRDL